MRLTQKNKIIIGVVFSALLIILFVWLRRKRSTFAVPTNNTGTSAPDNTFYNSYIAAQATFANSLSGNLQAFSSMTRNATLVTVKTIYPHGFVTSDQVIIGGVLGPNSAYNSPVSMSTVVTNSGISRDGTGLVTVTTSTAHGLPVGTLINIQGAGDYNTQAVCDLTSGASQNYGSTSAANDAKTSQCPSQLLTGTTPNYYIYPSAGSSVSAVPIVSVPTTTTFTYQEHPYLATGSDPYNIPVRETPTGTPGITVVQSGVPTPFTVTKVDDTTFTYTIAGQTGTETVLDANIGWGYKATNSSAGAAFVVKDKAISDAVTTWLNSKCTPLSSGINDAGYAANVLAINTAYSGLVNDYNRSPSTSADITYLNAARKADLTTALRTYLSYACANVYVGGPGEVDIAAGSNGSNGYKRNLSFTANGTGVDTGVITHTNVKKWAKYAAKDPTAASSAGTSALLLVADGTSYWTNTKTEPVTGASMQAWQIAKNFGPGSIYGNNSIGSSLGGAGAGAFTGTS